MQWLRRIVLVVFLFAPLAGSSSGVSAQDALVLGGGGSRGLAHAGAMEGLAEKGFRPDLVVGTSMGAIIGALHASGLSPDSIWQLSRGIDWQEIFAFPPVRTVPDGEPVRPFLNVGFKVDRNRYTDGLISDRRVNRLLVSVLFDAGARARSDFDRLPIRYRAVASDLATGAVVPLAEGDLARAVRSSMAVPGLFAPMINDEGRYLVDGGMSDYLPVATAIAAGARRVVAVDVIRPIADDPGNRNPFQVALRSFRLTLRNARPDGPEPDVAIEPAIDPDLSAAVFLRDATPLLEAGRRAVYEQFPDSLALPPGAGVENRRPAALAPSTFGDIHAVVNDPALATLVERAFRQLEHEPYDAQRVLDTADRLYATNFFDGIWPRIAPDGSLVVRADAQTPVLGSAAAGYDSDRGSRLFGSLRARRGASELSLAGRLGRLESWAALSMRRPLMGMPSLAPVVGITHRERDIRVFEEERVVAGREVHRNGGWAGLQWSGRDGRSELVMAFRADHISQDQGESGFVQGLSLRLAGREPNARAAGTPAVLEFERRWGDLPWSSIRARGAVNFGGYPVKLAVVGDIAVTSPDAPLDVTPSLGFDGGIPGLRFDSRRGPARVVTGLDVAVPVLFEGYARLRLRTGARARRFEDLDRAQWITGADVSVLWWTPFGRIATGIGVTGDGDWRATFDIGPRF